LDFIYIVDANAVSGQGHAAAITGSASYGYRYDSFGPGPRYGQEYFKTEQDAFDYAKRMGYTDYAKWTTTVEQDKAAKSAADKWHKGSRNTDL
jgi:hypothetical protein